MTTSIKVAATGIVALCLALSAIFYLQSTINPQMQAFGDKFLGFAVVLVLLVTVLAFLGIKVKLP